jgi:lipoate-protein ligase A
MFAWRLQIDAENDPAAALAGDALLLTQAARGQLPPTARIWRSRPCLVVPARQMQQPSAADAAAASAATGWPVVVRHSGGAPVPLDPGMVNLSLVFTIDAGDTWRIDDGFRLLTDTLIATFADLGLAAQCGEVAGAFCPGRYDLAVGGRKIAGTAQQWRGGRDADGNPIRAVLAHACLLAAPDLATGLAALGRWSERLGTQPQVSADRLTSVHNAAATREVSPSFTTDRLIAALARQVAARSCSVADCSVAGPAAFRHAPSGQSSQPRA